MKLFLIADDFTGAMDTGAQFAGLGAEVVVYTSPAEFLRNGNVDTDVVVVNSEARHADADNAERIIRELLACAGDVPVYLKTDSALRGNLSVTFAAALDVLGANVAFVPAWPASGRTTDRGMQYVNGLPLEKSSFGIDPLNPMRTSSIAAILNDTRSIEAQIIERASGIEKFSGGHGVYVFDAVTDVDMADAAERIDSSIGYRLTAGCAGFAPYAAQYLGLAAGTRNFEYEHGTPMVVISGSANSTTFAQIDNAKAMGAKVVHLTAEEYADGMPEFADIDNGNVIYAAAVSQTDVTEEMITHIESRIRAAAHAFEKTEYDICVVGGDTCRICLETWGVGSVKCLGTPYKGVSVCACVIGGHERILMTKSGGLGDADVLARIMR